MTFDVVVNPITGERGVKRQGASAENGHLLVSDLYAAPNSAVAGEHIHPHGSETFTVVRGLLGLKVDGVSDQAGPGDRITVPAGVKHDWWNAGQETALVIVETDQPRFEEMIKTLFFLAEDGKTDDRGRPGLLQAVAMAREFDDVVRFTKPPRAVQRILYGALAPLARLRGYRGTHPEYAKRVSEVVDALEELPPEIAAMLPAGVPGSLKPPVAE
ncbi:cupin domain-containing protein [Streptomyces sp. NPDC001250]|uniref:cupin domain-containing protein n=1 Tax=unclassified Streptomyces TaxID=2593676 RepID=UPI00331E7EFC